MTNLEQTQSVQELTRSFHPFCRIYAVGAFLFESAIIAHMLQKPGTITFAGFVFPVLIIIGSLLVVMNKPMGRAIFIPSVIIQSIVTGFILFLAFLSFMISGTSQSSQATTTSQVFSGAAAIGSIYLVLGVFILPLGVRKIDKPTM